MMQMLSQQHYSNLMTFISGSKAAKGLANVRHAFQVNALKSASPSQHAVVLS